MNDAYEYRDADRWFYARGTKTGRGRPASRREADGIAPGLASHRGRQFEAVRVSGGLRNQSLALGPFGTAAVGIHAPGSGARD